MYVYEKYKKDYKVIILLFSGKQSNFTKYCKKFFRIMRP